MGHPHRTQRVTLKQDSSHRKIGLIPLQSCLGGMTLQEAGIQIQYVRIFFKRISDSPPSPSPAGTLGVSEKQALLDPPLTRNRAATLLLKRSYLFLFPALSQCVSGRGRWTASRSLHPASSTGREPSRWDACPLPPPAPRGPANPPCPREGRSCPSEGA